MRSTKIGASISIALTAALVFHSTAALAGPLDTAASKGVTWLEAQRNIDDGGWGPSDDVKYLYTSEAVLALGALNQLDAAYYAGLAWLSNHFPANVDHTARRVLSTGAAQASVALDLSSLQTAQNTAQPGNNGWGLSVVYQGSALDTALALQALNQQNNQTGVSAAVGYLLGAQLTGTTKGWALGQETTADPVTTAHVLIALAPLTAVNTGVPGAITNGLAALNTLITTGSSPQLLALGALANLRNNATSTQGMALLNTLVSQQATDGGWGSDAYTTALALRAVAAGLSKDLAAQKLMVSMSDNNLRRAVNAALGHGALDNITRGQLAQITTLDISGQGIANLTGLEWATNLATLRAGNNLITSTTPLAGLKYLTQVDLSGNQVTLAPTTTAITPSVNPANKTTPMQLTATVTGSRPIGTVTFFDGSAQIGAVTLDATSPLVTSTNSKFVLTVTLSGGFRRLTAVYGGDAVNASSTSAVFTEMVNPDAAGILQMILQTVID